MSSPRVVSLLPSATEIVAALGFQDALVGRSHGCDFPPGVERLPVCTASRVDPDGDSREIHRRVERHLADAVSVYRLDAERLRRLAPTHVVTQVQCEVCAVSLREVEEVLGGESAGPPCVVALAACDLEGVFEDVRRVADALHAADRAAALVEGLRVRTEAIREKSSRLVTRPRVATIEWLAPPMAAGNWMPELIEMAGGENLFGEPGRHSPWLDPTALERSDPDAIIVFPCGFSLARLEAEANLLAQLPGWSRLRAVRRDAIFLADGNQYFNRPGPRLVETLEMVAEMLHPETFEFGHEGKAWRRWRPRPHRETLAHAQQRARNAGGESDGDCRPR